MILLVSAIGWFWACQLKAHNADGFDVGGSDLLIQNWFAYPLFTRPTQTLMGVQHCPQSGPSDDWILSFHVLSRICRLLDLKMKDGCSWCFGCLVRSSAWISSFVWLILFIISLTETYRLIMPAQSLKEMHQWVTFSIKAGQLVVIVCANGSGKSTILKLLSRCYDATSGTVLVDRNPIEDYQDSTCRLAVTGAHHIPLLFERKHILTKSLKQRN
jgi:ABC-type multidrug transport system fused ATPase/permease subunit